MNKEEKNVLYGRGLVDGIAEGEAIVSNESLVWSHGVDPQTGKIDDIRVKIYGQAISGKILVYPMGKGSTSGATWMLETIRCGNGPKAIVNVESELIIVAGAVLAGTIYNETIPVVDRLDKDPIKEIRTGDVIRVDGKKGTVEIIKRKKDDANV